jgi:hypothetical protein
MRFCVTATQRASLLALGLALAVVACDNKAVTPAVATHTKVSSKPKPSASITVLGGDTASASPAGIGASSLDTPSSTAPSASSTPVVAVSAPPLIVKSVTADGAALANSFILTDLQPALIPLPNQGKATSFAGNVKKDVANPYALGVLFPKAGTTVTDTITGVATESLTVAGGTFDTTKYTINEQADGSKSTITLWTQKDGSMVKEVIAGDKPPPLVDFSALGAMASAVNGPTTTTLELKSVGVAVADPVGSAATDPHASGAASADPHATTAATSDPNATGSATPTPVKT